MKTLIAYCTSHGCTEKAAIELSKNMGPDVILCNLRKEKHPPLNDFNTIIIGGSIHAGQIQKRIKSFCKKNLMLLQEKELGVFICCMEEGETAQQQLNDAFPPELHQNAKAEAIFGGEFNLEKLNFAEKFIVKKVANVTQNVSTLNKDIILKFSKRMKNELYVA